MAMNDAVDAERDALEGRERPIQQGLISQGFARIIALVLLASCVLICIPLAAIRQSAAVVFVALALAAAITAYNWYKATPAGPLLMGTCRFLNVQLGSIIGEPFLDVPPPFKGSQPPGSGAAWLAAVMIGVYVVGITVFARDEASVPNRFRLLVGTVISAASLSIFAYGEWPPIGIQIATWWLIWGIVALIATRGMVAGILQPTPKNIGRGVGIAIQGLVVIDATLATLYAGPVAGLAILALLPVTMFLARWIPQT
jgi:4-hydroxybenzoate polyprenyltransferase